MRVLITDCLPAFKNAHEAILYSCEAHFPKMKVIVKKWHKEYGVKIIGSDVNYTTWVALEFKSKEYYLEWLLKWSG